jgi:alanyl-tRNA synthetase
MTSNEIRRQFLDFFKSKKHTIVPSAPIVVKDDPTLMFINSGMAPFKDIFLGNKPIAHPRIADTQKCLRVSGKHNDLEEVGVDTYHHTMFEMLGNWSFGDYFKKEAIEWSWELLVKIYGLKTDRLYVTVFEGDEKENLSFDADAYNEWKKWIAEDRILKGNKKDNFWEMGDTGPCGPCSEIHYDLRSDEERKKTDGKSLVNAGHPQVIEIWNNVFMEFERKADGSLVKLAKQHVDTGMGFERLCVAIQGKTSNYDTDVFTPLINNVEELSGKKYGKEEKGDIAMRVIADHIRAVAFTIADGQLPSNTGAGYVIRRILRRAVRYGYSYLGFEEPFMYKLVDVLAKQLGEVFPEIVSQKQLVEKVIQEEETSFFRTLKKGIERIDDIVLDRIESINIEILRKFVKPNSSLGVKHGEILISKETHPDLFLEFKANGYSEEKINEIIEDIQLKYNKIEGKDIFELYDTYGFPFDLTKLLLFEKGFRTDDLGFQKEMEAQKIRSREATQTEASDWIEVQPINNVQFVGYDDLETESRIVKYRKITQKNKELFQVVLDKTPFYAESGGQVGDKGKLTFNGETLEVLDTKKENDLIVHFTDKLPQHPEAVYRAEVDKTLRRDTVNNHSATHLLHAALRKVLGTHVEQKGSLVAPDYLRFDFSHFSKVTDEQLKEIETIVNEKILENIHLDERRDVPINDAKALGAMALFGEKYGDKVRVIIFDKDYSVELCGGCHVKSTGQIGFFKITTETSVAAGIRRVEAVTGMKAIQLANAAIVELANAKAALNNAKDLLKAIEILKDENSSLKKLLQQFEDKQIAETKKQIIEKIETIGNVQFYASTNIDVSSADSLRKLGMQLTQELKDNFILILATTINDKNMVHLRVAPSLGLNANQLLKELYPSIKGGGPADFVQASAANMREAEDLIKKIKSEKLKS